MHLATTSRQSAPPPPHDSTASCDSYPLVSGTNRETDVTNAPTSLERLNYRSADEDRIILNLLQRDINYRDDLIYCWNPDGTMTYNSNSYTAGLLKAASIPSPTFPSLPFSLYVGWTKPVPKTQFDPH